MQNYNKLNYKLEKMIEQMRFRSFVMLMAALLSAAMANAQYTVKLQANDGDGAGEPYATIHVYNAADTTRVLNTGVTELDGSYSQALAAAGSYLLRVTAVGKVEQERTFSVNSAQPVADLGIIVLTTAENMLEGVTVTSQRVLVRNEIDRVAYDVQADAESKVNTALDMLRKVPMVSVDGQDNITVKGSSNFKIYKNGHPDAAMSANAKDILKAIPASMIKKIEVITEPGAKYDAEGVGAILNIVMMEASAVKGVTGTVSGTVDNMGTYRLNGYLTAQYNKFITSINYGMMRGNRHRQHQFSEGEHEYVESGNLLRTEQENRGSGMVHFGNIEASWEPDTLNLLTFNFGGYYGGFSLDGTQHVSMLDALRQPIYSYTNTFRYPDGGYGFFSFNGRFDYQHRTHRKDETLTLSYLLSTTRNTNNGENSYSEVSGIDLGYDFSSTANRENFIEHTLQFDWTRPFAKYHKIETGVKYINRSNRSRTVQEFMQADEAIEALKRFNKLEHTTQVAAAYLSYTFNMDKWSARAGLRYEYSRLSAKFPLGDQNDYHRNLNDWVPSASVNYQMDWSNSFKLAFATRIARPGISYLNPAVVENVTSRSYGDPYLASARNYSLSFTYMHLGPKFTFNISPSYDFSSNGITGVSFIADDGKEVSTYANTLRNRQLNLNGFFQWQLHEKTSLMFNGGAYYEWLHSPDLDIRNSAPGGWFFLQLTQQLPWKLRLSVNGGAWGGGTSGLYAKNNSSWWSGLSLQRSFLKDDRLTVRLAARNIFSKYGGYKTRYVNGPYRGFEHNHWVQRSFELTVSYRFGSLKASVKKSTTTIDNNDLVGGSNTSGATGGTTGGGNTGGGATGGN